MHTLKLEFDNLYEFKDFFDNKDIDSKIKLEVKLKFNDRSDLKHFIGNVEIDQDFDERLVQDRVNNVKVFIVDNGREHFKKHGRVGDKIISTIEQISGTNYDSVIANWKEDVNDSSWIFFDNDKVDDSEILRAYVNVVETDELDSFMTEEEMKSKNLRIIKFYNLN